jgi:hypothetical protein
MRHACICLLVVGCGAAPTAVAVSTPPVTSNQTAPTAVAALDESCALGARRLSTDAPSAWGSTQPSVWLTQHDVWYPSSSRGPQKNARLDANGTLASAADVELFGSFGEANNPVVAEDGDVVAYAETVYRRSQDADVMLAFKTRGRWGNPIALMPNPDLDEDPAMAFSGGKLAVAWKHGVYPSAPDLALAIVTTDGRVLRSSIIEQSVEPEGIAVVGVPHGWLLVYTPSSVLPHAQRGLVVVALDEQGTVVSRNVVTKHTALWPVAAWNGREVGVAFRDETDSQSVGFLRLGPDGHALANVVVVADQHADPLVSFRPTSLVPDKAGWWLADVASFHASVMIARASEGRVVELAADGQPRRSVVVSDRDAGASIVRVARQGGELRGVFVEDRGNEHLRAFTLGCGEAPKAAPADACAARTTTIPPDHYTPFRALVESAAPLAGDLVVGYRPMQRGPYGLVAGDVNVSRMARDGAAMWNTSLGPTFHPALAIARGHVGVLVQTGSGSGQSLVVLDAARGTISSQRATAADAGTGCIAEAASGWLIVSGEPYNHKGSPTAVVVADDGAPRERHDLDEPIQACSLLRTSNGFLLAYTHPGPISETAWLFTRELDEHGRARGAGKRVRDIGFATSPALVASTQPVLLFADALGRNLSAVVLDAHGAARSAAIDVAQTYGLWGFALWGSDIVWGSSAGLGRRGCLDKLLVP